MRIALYADRLARHQRTGVGTYMFELVQALAEIDQDELVMVSARGGEGRFALPDDLPTVHLRGPGRLREAVWALTHRPRIHGVAGPVDAVHVLLPTSPVPSTAPIVLTIHDLTPITHPEFYSRRARGLFRLAVERAVADGAHIITVSETVASDVARLLKLPAHRIHPVRHGPPARAHMDDAAVDRILGQHELSSGKYVLFLGNLTSRKDPLSLVRAFRLIHDRFPDIELVFAGALGSGAVGILAEIDELRLGRRVRVIGHVSDDDATGLLLGAAVLSLPSLYEGFGLPVLEAMACGIPVVASNGGALPEVIGDAGIVVPAQRPDALSDALRAVLSDSGLRRELKSAGRARVREFSWVRCAEETSAVYRVATSAGVAPNRRASGYPSASHRADRARGESTR